MIQSAAPVVAPAASVTPAVAARVTPPTSSDVAQSSPADKYTFDVEAVTTGAAPYVIVAVPIVVTTPVVELIDWVVSV